MSPDAVAKDEPPPSASRKSAAARPQEPALRCPRCDSPNTKFCYYNNYSLTQPRHFCKTCRRYWTKGGALRSVPIGGGCRKNKKMRSSPPLSADSNGSSSDLAAGLKFFQGVAPAMDFQLNFPGLQPHPAPTAALLNQFSGFVDSANTSAAIPSNPCYSLDLSATSSPLMGFNLPNSNQEIGFRSILASSIESLSSINQDLHWKLQKQRLAALLPGENQKTGCDSTKPQPILFQDLEIPSKEESCGIRTPRKDGGGNLSTEWFFDSSSYATAAAAAAATSINGMNGENGAGGWSNGVQAWSDISQYSSIP